MAYELRSARWIAHDVLTQVVREGDHVIDATLGNGHDTVMLAELVGEKGHVTGFDIQADAVERTALRLREAGLDDRCTLHATGHQHIAECVTEPVKAAVFNLGWLPGGDKSITTLWETTQAAILAALSLLVPGGVCTVCAYPGHAEGDRERFALMDFLASLRPQEFNVLHHRFLNAGPGAPECFVIQKNLLPQKKRKVSQEKPEVVVRSAGSDDAETLAALALCMWEHVSAGDFRSLTAQEDAACFLAFAGDQPIGFAQCQLRHDYVEGCDTSPVGFLEGVYVQEAYRRAGVARQLLSACCDWAKGVGCTEFASDCEIDNDESRAWHLASGFEESGRTIWFHRTL